MPVRLYEFDDEISDQKNSGWINWDDEIHAAISSDTNLVQNEVIYDQIYARMIFHFKCSFRSYAGRCIVLHLIRKSLLVSPCFHIS